MNFPYSEAVEGSLIARLLIQPNQAAVLAGNLASEDFYVEDFRRAYAQIQKFTAEHRPFDILTLETALGDKEGDLQEYLDRVAAAPMAPIEEYAAIVRRDAFRRRMIGSLEGVIRKVQVEEDREKLLADLHDAVVEVSRGVEQGNLISPTQASDIYCHLLDRRQRGGFHGLSYGFRALDRILNPAQGGDMIVIAARPSVGKSAMAETFAERWAGLVSDPILFVSIEMNLGMVIDRAVARATGLESSRIIRGSLDEEGEALARQVAEARSRVNLWYLDDPYATTSSIRAAAAKVRILAGGLSAVIIDYLQLLKDGGDQEVQRVTRISRQIKAIAREFDVPVIALSQLNRNVEMRNDPHPQLHDLRESGAIEQDADVVIGLYRELGTSIMDVEVLKQRQGGMGRVQLHFDSSRVRYSSLEEGTLAEMAAIKAATPGGYVGGIQ